MNDDHSSEAMMISTAVPRSTQYMESLNRLQSMANGRTVPSRILHTAPTTLFTMSRFDGRQDFALKQSQWEQHYFDLHLGQVNELGSDSKLPSLADLKEIGRRHTAQNVVPIAIFNLHHHYPNKRLISAVAAAARHDRAIRLPSDPATMLDDRRGFAASALLPDVFDNFVLLPHAHYGLNVSFLLDRDLYISNTQDGIVNIEADFDDGVGFRTVLPNRPVPVRYGESGTRTIRIIQHTASGVLKAAFTLDIRSSAALQPDTYFNVKATIPYQGQTNSGVAYVMYGYTNGVKHAALTNPMIISEGFPGGYSWDYLYGVLNTQGALTSLLNNGYDAVVLTYGQTGANGGSDYIQRSAFVAVACIQTVIQLRSGSAQLVVGGASMGGVITRYALSYMEQNNLDHQTSIFLSFDSPQQGANVPVSVQWFIQALAGQSSGAAATAKVLSSPAAQQMMYYYVPSYTYSGPLTSPMHTALYGSLTYPTKPRLVGIADGSGNGTQTIPDAAHVIDWYGSPCASGDTWAEMTGSGQVAALSCIPLSVWKKFTFSVTNCVNYDGCPGGSSNANGQLAQQLIDSDHGWVDHNYDNCCFIPSVSALDIAGATPYTPIAATGAKSAFNSYFVSDSNYAHVLITPQILAFLMTQFPAVSGVAEGSAAVSAAGAGSTRAAPTGSVAYTQTSELPGEAQTGALGRVAQSSDGSTVCVPVWDGIFVFTQSQGVWTLQTKIPATNPVAALSSDGSSIVVLSGTASTATVTVLTGANWTTEAPLALPSMSENQMPISVAMSGDGTAVLVGIIVADSSAPGQALLFQSSSGCWNQSTSFAGASNAEAYFGCSVALSANGSVAAVGGITVNAYGHSYGGFAYVFSGSNWGTKTALPQSSSFQPAYGAACSMSNDGSVIAIVSSGAYVPPNNAAGAVVIFSGAKWQQRTTIVSPSAAYISIGSAVLSADGTTLALIANDFVSSQALYIFANSTSGWSLAVTPALPAGAQTTLGQVAMSGDKSVIAVGGRVNTYSLTGSDWSQSTVLTTPVDIGGLDFGSSLAIDAGGVTALIGAPGMNALVGGASIYSSSGSGWSQQEVIGSPDMQALAQFGCSVALNSNADTAAFGVRGDSKGAGCAYIFSGYNWSAKTRVAAPTQNSGDNFGVSVSLSAEGGVLVVGAPGTNSNTGALYVFSGTEWDTSVCLTASAELSGNNLGYSTAISADGSVIVAGAPNANDGSGCVYVFSGSGYSQITAVALSGNPVDAAFGLSVDITSDGTTIIAGAPQVSGGIGAAYVLSGEGWATVAALPINGSAGDAIGDSVAISGDGSTVVVGAPGTTSGMGAVYVASGAGFAVIEKVLAADGTQGDGFGDAVAVSGNGSAVLVGAPGKGYGSGTVYAYSSAAASAPSRQGLVARVASGQR